MSQTAGLTAIESETSAGLDSLVALLKASGDSLRLQILRVLRQDSFGVLELCEILDVKQSGMSHHLKQLANAGLVSTRREGNSIFYRRSMLQQDSGHNALRQAIFNAADEAVQLDGHVLGRFSAIQRQRAESSRDFFSRNAEKFQQQQDLIADFPQYGENVAEVTRNLPLKQRKLAIEIGPGAGEFLPVLAGQFDSVLAVDNSRSMLDRSEQTARNAKLENVRFELNGAEDLALKEEADLVVTNMVLHHIPGPAELFNVVSALLKPGGVFVVTDLCQHDQGWARENCGDLWLGFENEELIYWAGQAGLEHRDSQFLAMRNGFQVQVCSFLKLEH